MNLVSHFEYINLHTVEIYDIYSQRLNKKMKKNFFTVNNIIETLPPLYCYWDCDQQQKLQQQQEWFQ